VLRRTDERGFTLIELAVAMSILLLVAGALLAALESGTNAEHNASNRIDVEQSVAAALAQFQRDVRNATEVNQPTNKNQIDLNVGTSHIRWWYNAAGHQLVRKIYLPTGTYNGVTVNGVTNPAGTTFTLLSADGTNLLTLADASHNDVLACVATIGVSVTTLAPAPSQPFTEGTQAPLEVTADQRGCP
jgi:prepilin-type N-terminal cleavage/methylation domain-containing protein